MTSPSPSTRPSQAASPCSWDDKGLSGKQLLGGAAVAGVAGYGALKLAGPGPFPSGQQGGRAGLSPPWPGRPGLAGLKLPLPVYVVNKQMSLTREAMLGQSGGAPAAPGAPGGKKAGKGKMVSGAQLDGAKSAGPGRGSFDCGCDSGAGSL